MARKLFWGFTVAILVLVGATAASENPTRISAQPENRATDDLGVHATTVGMTKAEVDTVYMLGGPGAIDGTFEENGQPNWHGWESIDFTNDESYAWNIQTGSHALDGSYSMVCGIDWEIDGDTDFGYGNDWLKYLVFGADVPNPDEAVEVRITGIFTVDTEQPGDRYDWVRLQANTSDGWDDFLEDGRDYPWFGEVGEITSPADLDYTITLNPEDFQGPGSSRAELRFFFYSDAGWSDEDGIWDTDGGCHLDNLAIYFDGNLVDYEDFEDNVSDHWIEELAGGVGDYAQLYLGLQDIDPCASNSSYQVIFIDDNEVVPGTGGTLGVTWLYGPEGYVVNHRGGLLGPEYYIENAIMSPVLAWPDGYDAGRLGFGVYRHEEMIPHVSSGIMYRWYVRSTASENPADIENVAWIYSGSNYYGVGYGNHDNDFTAYMETGRQWVQVMLMCVEFGWYWDVDGDDGSPAPYFDNVRVYAHVFDGPAITHDALFLAQDNFPEQGDFNFSNLGSNHIRFDTCYNMALPQQGVNEPGDSLTITVTPVRAGSVLDGQPEMRVRMKANPLFDAVRVLPPDFSQAGDIIEGTVVGDTVYNNNWDPPTLVDNRWEFDLPDTGFFYPGDVIHYYFVGKDNYLGDVGTTLLPGDTTGFASFDHDLQYPSDFICRGLPSLQSASIDDQPEILFWNDFGNRGGENEWLFALKSCGLVEGIGYDVYYTNRPDAGEGNGLGERTTSALMAGYDILLYTSGDLTTMTLGNGDAFGEISGDIQLLLNWFARGGKKAFFTGDGLLSDLVGGAGKGADASNLVNSFFEVELIHGNLAEYIDQTAPVVETFGGNSVISTVNEWIAYGGCPRINTIDAVEIRGTATALAEFCDAQGNTGVYPYAAGIYHYNETTDAEVVYLPYDFMYVYGTPDYTPPGAHGVISARAVMLRDILNFFGMQLDAPIGVDDTPELGVLAVQAYPNPFNPRTTIKLSLPRSGHVAVKIFNVRGELVLTLHDGALAAGVHELVWDGRDRSGAASASGVYFAETRALEQTRVTRMAMIK